MPRLRPRLIGLCLPPLLFFALDLTLTLMGQSQGYWAGNYAAVNEGSPTFNHLLQFHPFAAIGFGCVVAAMYAALILALPDVLALAASIAITFGHATGALTWMLFRYQYGYQMCNALFLGAGILLALCIRYGWGAAPQTPPPLGHWPWWVRTAFVLALFGFGVYLYLWPRLA